MVDCTKIFSTGPSIGSHSFMVHEIESRTSGDTVNNLCQLAIDIVCNMVYFKIESFSAGNSMFTEYSVIDHLPLPKHVTDVVST